MIYMFEDDERDPIPQLFQCSYDRQMSDCFIYTRGNGNIYNSVESLINNTDEQILVYLDTIPGNLDTRRIYVKLSALSRKNNYRVIVMPIIGSEYLFIRSVERENVILSQEDIRICVELRPYFTSKMLKGEQERKYCTSYKKYCKLILKKESLDCIRNSEDNGANRHFRWYYSKDCGCEDVLKSCKDKTLQDKSAALLNSYPIIPRGSKLDDLTKITIDGAWKIHRELVDVHNVLCNKLMQAEPNMEKKNNYKLIKYIKEVDLCI